MDQSQPDEPTPPPAEPTPEPGEASPTSGVPEPARRRRSWKTVLLVIASIMGVLCSSTVGYALWWYNQETKPDRSAPDVVVDNYLRNFLQQGNEVRASNYTCKNPTGLAALGEMRSDLEAREAKYGIDIRISWSTLTVSGDPQSPTVSTDIRQTIAASGESFATTWIFQVVEEEGWRVCSASPGV